jgi:hypothetical protein
MQRVIWSSSRSHTCNNKWICTSCNLLAYSTTLYRVEMLTTRAVNNAYLPGQSFHVCSERHAVKCAEAHLFPACLRYRHTQLISSWFTSWSKQKLQTVGSEHRPPLSPDLTQLHYRPWHCWTQMFQLQSFAGNRHCPVSTSDAVVWPQVSADRLFKT